MGNSGTPYNLPWPEQNEIADVPTDMHELVTALVIALNGKMSPSDVSAVYQPKILTYTSLAAAPPASSTPEGTIIFIVP